MGKIKVKMSKANAPDNRFDEVNNDPRFVVAPQKVTKVAVDARFGAMFGKGKKGDKMAKDFNIISKVDKYGRKNRVEDKQVYENFYQMEKDEEDPLQKKYYDEDGKFKWEQESSS